MGIMEPVGLVRALRLTFMISAYAHGDSGSMTTPDFISLRCMSGSKGASAQFENLNLGRLGPALDPKPCSLAR